MGKYKKLVNNSLLFLIANFGSKILTFVMVPYYTYVLTTSQYGTVDIVVSTVALISPLVTFGIGDIVTLYLVKKEYSEEKIFTNSFFILLIGNILIFILFPLISSIDAFKQYVIYFFGLITAQSFYVILQSYSRGAGKVVHFAISGIMYTAILVSLNVFFLTILKLEIKGYLLSMILAYTISSLYLLLILKFPKLLVLKLIDKNYIVNLLKLSLPLLPTAILWWLMNICDKYTLLFFMSASANGLYTVAHKLPTIIATIYSVFQQAWQLTSLEMSTKSERSEMFSNMFEILTSILVIATSILIVFSKLYVVVFCQASYSSAWVITPILLISAIFNALSGFFESNYFLMKNTREILKITTIGTIINFVLNLILVPIIGLYGAAIATCAGFLYMTVRKMIGTKNFTPLHINLTRFIFSIIILIIQSFLSIYLQNQIIYLIGFFVFILLLFLYRDIWIKLGNKIYYCIFLKK